MAKRQISTVGRNDMQRYAALGAQARLAVLRKEIDLIQAAFPQLREGETPSPRNDEAQPRRRGRPAKMKVAVGISDKNVMLMPPAPKAKRTMSPEARKRISDAQRARWAKQKAGGKKR